MVFQVSARLESCKFAAVWKLGEETGTYLPGLFSTGDEGTTLSKHLATSPSKRVARTISAAHYVTREIDRSGSVGWTIVRDHDVLCAEISMALVYIGNDEYRNRAKPIVIGSGADASAAVIEKA